MDSVPKPDNIALSWQYPEFFHINTIPTPKIVHWVVSMSLQVQNFISHRLVIVIDFLVLCTEFIYISVKGCYHHKVCLTFLLQWNFVVVGIFDR